jgi:integrase
VHLATSLKAIARHYVRVDAQHLERMAAVIGRLDPPKRGLTVKNRSRLRALDDPKTALALVQLPAKLMGLADREQQYPLRAARLAQTAVVIEILLMAPIRVGNLSTLDIERHLIRPSRTANTLHIVINSDETKNREPLEYPLPPGSIELIERYLARFRPALAPAGGSALFPGGSNGCKHGNSLRQQIGAAVFAHTGMRVHPHLFRHIAAKLFLDDNPGSYEVIRQVLGHRSIETTTAFYTGLETAAAVRHFDQTILKLRKGGGRS